MKSLIGINILEVLRNPLLLGRAFRKRLFRGDSWHAWRAFLCALFALNFEDDAAVQTYRACTGRKMPPHAAFREAFIIAGRRSGKSFIISAIAVFVAAFMDFAPYLSPGETPTILIIASDKAQAQIILRYIRAFFRGSEALRSMVASDLKESLVLTNGVEILVQAGDYRSVRGKTIICCLLDECAWYGGAEGPASDVELLTALRPSMITIPNALLLAISSPYARRGIFYNEYAEHFGKDDAPTLVWKADSRTMNPTISKQAIDSAYQRDPIAARSEYGAEFRSDLESYVGRETVEACTDRGVDQRAPLRRHDYYGFVDPSGGRSDSFCLGIGHTESGITILDYLGEIPSPSKPDECVAVYADILKRYRLSEVTGDRYAGAWPEDSFAKHGISYRPSEKDRSAIYTDFLPQLTSGRTRLLDDARILNQLTSLERRTGAGRDKIDHAPGAHDDCANVVAGVLDLCRADESSFAVLEILHDRFTGKTPIPSDDVNPHFRDQARNREWEMERALRELPVATLNPCNAEKWKPEKVPPCPHTDCKATCRVAINNQFHCNQCGRDTPNPAFSQEILVCTRDGPAMRTMP